MESLFGLNLTKCSKLNNLKDILDKMGHLHVTRAVDKASIENAAGHQYLSLMYFSERHSLPQSRRDIKCFLFIDGTYGHLPSSVSDLSSLVTLDLSACRSFIWPVSLSGLSSLSSLHLAGCGLSEIPPQVGELSSLKILDLMGNNFESLPTSIKDLSNLKELYLTNCNMLQSLPELPLELIILDVSYCSRLESLPELPSSLQELDASELEISSKRIYHDDDYLTDYYQLFLFLSCRKLNANTSNNILADSQQRIQHLVVACIKNWCEMVGPYAPLLVFPGSQIPEWFSHQSSGTSITIPLSPFCCNTNFIGVAFCAVIAVGGPHPAPDCKKFTHMRNFQQIYCYFEIRPPSKAPVIDIKCFLKDVDCFCVSDHVDCFYESDHVVFGFVNCLPCDGHGDGTAVSFDIFNYYPYYQHKRKVKRVGVCPIYAHASETKPNTFTVNMEPPTEEEYKKFHNDAGTSGTAIPTDAGRDNERENQQQHSSFLSQIFSCRGLDCTCLRRLFKPCF